MGDRVSELFGYPYIYSGQKLVNIVVWGAFATNRFQAERRVLKALAPYVVPKELRLGVGDCYGSVAAGSDDDGTGRPWRAISTATLCPGGAAND
jgi:hypothetical protein